MATIDKDELKIILSRTEKLLRNNDIKGFYESGYINSENGGPITDFLMENGIDLFNYLYEIPRYMFANSEQDTIVIPDHIKKINRNAFEEAKVRQVQIGDGVTAIGNNAFRGCGNLTSVIFPDSVQSLGKQVFEGCSDRLILYANRRKPGTRLRCPKNEIGWYKDHLFVTPEADGEQEEE